MLVFIMPTLTLATVGNSTASFGAVTNEIYVGFMVTEMDTSVDPLAMLATVLAVPGMPQFNALYPYNFSVPAYLQNIEVEGIMPDAVVGRLVYKTIPGGGDGNAYVITRSSRNVDHTENILPSGFLIQPSFRAPGADSSQRIGPIPTSINVRRPCSTIVIEGLRYGNPNYAANDYVGFVNQDVYQGRQKGCWLIDEFTTTLSVYSGYHSFRFVALGNVLGRPWITFVTLVDPQTGQYVKIDQDDLTSAIALEYDYGEIGAWDDAGFTPVGPYPLVNFSQFGF